MRLVGPLLALSSLWLGACGAGVAWVEPPPTTQPPSRTLVLAGQGAGGLEVRALALDPGGALGTPLRLEPPVDGRLEALLYPSPPAALGLPEGLLSAPGSGAEARSLPAPAHAFSAAVRADRSSGWTERAAMSDGLRTFRYSAGAAACARFESAVVALDTAAETAFAVALDAERALVGTADRRVYVVERSGAVRAVEVVAPRALWSAARGEAGDLWFGGERGELLRGAFGAALELTPVASAPSRGRLHWLAGGTGPDGFELYSLSLEGSVERFRLGRWASVHQFEPTSVGTWAGGVARAGQNQGLAAWPTVRAVARADGDASSLEDTGALSGISALAVVPGLGPVAGTSEGAFHVRRDVDWFPLDGSRFALFVLAITPYEDGFVYAGAVGNFGQWRPGTGFCPLAQPAPNWVQQVVVLGEDLLLVGSNGGVFPRTPVTILRRAPDG